MVRISYELVFQELQRILRQRGFTSERAALCARLFAQTSLDGVYSHGLNRFPRFIQYIEKGYINVLAEPEKIAEFGALERWNGNLGPGNLNAHFCMQRAIHQAQQHGIGCVALQNTNHWMRAGSYGLQAADAGCIGICWTNTEPNMPPWGAKQRAIGNNPLVFAVPGSDNRHILLDIALSQYSYGKLESYRLRNEQLPYDGGFDEHGHLTCDPGAIEQSRRPLSIGYWKGSGLAILFDLAAALLSGGKATWEIGKLDSEYALSQVFIAFAADKMLPNDETQRIRESILESVHAVEPTSEGGKVNYPGERMYQTRLENIRLGIPVEEHYWEKILMM